MGKDLAAGLWEGITIEIARKRFGRLSYTSTFSRIRLRLTNRGNLGQRIGPLFLGKAISPDCNAEEIHASTSSAVTVTSTGSQLMPSSG
jgi:hypothetical protein